MPGQTNNPTILSAENQEIVALNEIKTAIEGLSTPVVTVDLSGLQAAITALGSTLSTALENLSMQVNQTVNCGCCGSSGTVTTTPATPIPTPGGGQPGAGGPSDPPPAGTSIPPGTTDEVKARQCKAATFVVDTLLITVVQKLDQTPLDTMINAVFNGVVAVLSVTEATTVIAATVSVLFPPIAAGFITTAVVEAALLMAVNSLEVDFSNMSSWLVTNRDKLICALTNADYPIAARLNLNAMIASISPGLSTGNQLFLNNILPYVVFDFLFYLNTQFAVFEPELASITEPCPCTDIDPSTDTPTDDYKCKAANYIFDSFTDTLTNFGGFHQMSWYSVATFIASLGTGLLSSTFAGIFGLLYGVLTATIPQLISYLGTIYWRGTGYFVPFGLVAAEFEANKEAIICELYEAADVAAARAALAIHITDYVGSVMTAHPEYQQEQQTYLDAITALLPNAVLNELFKTGADERAEINSYAPADFYDCQCGGGSGPCADPQFTWLLGSGDLTADGAQRTLTAQNAGNGVYYIRFQQNNGVECCNVGINILSKTGNGTLSWEIPFEECGNPANYSSGVVQFNVEHVGGTSTGYPGMVSLTTPIGSGPFSLEVIIRAI